jgi:polyisoprenoid-binding protein YceI
MSNQWNLDPTHSEIGFKVKHLMMTNVSGSFKNFEAAVENDSNDFTNASVSFSADTSSVNTGNEQRDGHLVSPDFFYSANFPKLSFKSTSIEKVAEGEFKLHGELTIKDTTKPLTLDVDHGGFVKDPWGNNKAGFSIAGKISRKDWGLVWNAPLETGGLLLNDEVKLAGEVQFSVQA